jgi:hypothetical protein
MLINQLSILRKLYELTESSEIDTDDSKVSPTIDFHLANSSSFFMGLSCMIMTTGVRVRAGISYLMLSQDAQTHFF